MATILTNALLHFIKNSPSPFHAVEEMKSILLGEGFEELQESKSWSIVKGGKYFVTRNNSSIIAFRIPEDNYTGFQIMASHSDSPTFKIKDNSEIGVEGKYIKLNVEKYGGMICSSWFDRPLSVAGRVIVREGDKLCTRLVNIDRDLLVIPNLAIHMNRDINDGYKYNVQKDMLPLYSCGEERGIFKKQISEAVNVSEADILGEDLYLYNRMPGTVWGANEEFVSSPKLDDLQCAFGTMMGLIESQDIRNVAVCCVLDNEEVGSETKQGAASTFLKDTIERIQLGMHREEPLSMLLSSSFMVSADNAHAVHPNYADMSDPTNRPFINGGIVIKASANQKYTTDGIAAAMCKNICDRARVPYQTFLNRSDMLGGSTLGNISNTKLSLNTVDIGLPQLAMHSSYETAGVTDTAYLVDFSKCMYEAVQNTERDGMYSI